MDGFLIRGALRKGERLLRAAHASCLAPSQGAFAGCAICITSFRCRQLISGQGAPALGIPVAHRVKGRARRDAAPRRRHAAPALDGVIRWEFRQATPRVGTEREVLEGGPAVGRGRMRGPGQGTGAGGAMRGGGGVPTAWPGCGAGHGGSMAPMDGCVCANGRVPEGQRRGPGAGVNRVWGAVSPGTCQMGA